MRFHGDLTQATNVYRDMAIYDATATGIIAGQMVGLTAVNASEGKGGVIDASAAMADIVGVTAEAPASALSVMAAGTEKFCKVIINPCAYFLAEYTMESTNTNETASSTGEAVVVSTVDANQEGGWVYINGPSTDTGYGNLFKIGAQTSTTTLTNATGAAYDDELTANTTSSTFSLLRSCLATDPTGGAIVLDSTFAKIDAEDVAAGAGIILENYISHNIRFPFEPLRVEKHCGKQVPGAIFYADLYPTDHAFRVATTY